MKILIACEESGTVRTAFARLGYNPISCDILPSARPGLHYQGDVRKLLSAEWDLIIAFPPCTFLTYARPMRDYKSYIKRQQAINFFIELLHAPAKHIAIENPVGVMNTLLGRCSQVIHPWQFGHEEEKRTCLWLRNLPVLTSTNIMEKRTPRLAKLGSCPSQSKIRSKTFEGIANAMATQWSEYVTREDVRSNHTNMYAQGKRRLSGCATAIEAGVHLEAFKA